MIVQVRLSQVRSSKETVITVDQTGFHTVQMNVNGVAGTIQIQGTLATTPAEADYFNIAGALYDSTTAGKDGSFVFNFTGNFVWIRAVLVYTDGTVNSVLLNN